MLITIFPVAKNLLFEDSLRTFNVNIGRTHGTLDTVVNVTSPSYISLHNFFIIPQLIIPIFLTLHVTTNF